MGKDTEKKLKECLVHTQAFFCHSSLGSKIHLKGLSIAQNKNGLNAGQITKEGIEGADLALIFSYPVPDVLGWAYQSTICMGDWGKQNRFAVTYWHNDSPATNAWVSDNDCCMKLHIAVLCFALRLSHMK